MEEPPADTEKQLTDVATASDGIRIMISYALWAQWGDIAVEREGRARDARADVMALARHRQEYGPALHEELLASMVAISAASHALDALYGQLVTLEIKAAGPGDDKHREAHIRECLKRRFNTGKRDQPWVGEFRWLFALRDAAVHAEEKQLPSVLHPSGVTHSGQVALDYSADAAIRAVDLMLDVLNTCADNPKQSDAGARQWADSYGPSIRTLTAKLQVSRAARPLPPPAMPDN